MLTAKDLNNRFAELKASTNENAYSGLMAEDLPEPGSVKIFDDYASGTIDSEVAMNCLADISPITWDEHDNTETAFEPIWNALVSAGLSV